LERKHGKQHSGKEQIREKRREEGKRKHPAFSHRKGYRGKKRKVFYIGRQEYGQEGGNQSRKKKKKGEGGKSPYDLSLGRGPIRTTVGELAGKGGGKGRGIYSLDFLGKKRRKESCPFFRLPIPYLKERAGSENTSEPEEKGGGKRKEEEGENPNCEYNLFVPWDGRGKKGKEAGRNPISNNDKESTGSA